MANKLIVLGLLGAIFLAISITETSNQTFAQTSVTKPEKGLPKDYGLIIPRKSAEPFIFLKSRLVVPGVGIDPEVRKRLEALPPDRVHVLLYLDHIPKSREREQLRKNGIALLSYIHNNGWLASVPKNKLEEVAKTPPIRWVGEILPEDKLGSTVRTQKFGNWSYDPVSDTVNLTIFFFKDISTENGAKFVSRYEARLLGEAPPINALVARVPVKAISSLSKEDSVQWIEEVEPPGTEDNDQLREAIGVNTVQAPPYNLSGTHVEIVQFESNVPMSTHPDLLGRVTLPFGGTIDDHPTHVAGTAIGSGNLRIPQEAPHFNGEV